MQTLFLTMLLMAGDWNATVRQGTDAFHARKVTESLRLYEEAWKLAETPVQKAVTANDLGANLHALGRDKEARTWYERGLEFWRSLPDHAEELAETGLSLSDIYRGDGDFAAAEKIMREMLETKVSNEGRATILNSMGDMLREQSRKEEARQCFEAAPGDSGSDREAPAGGAAGAGGY